MPDDGQQNGVPSTATFEYSRLKLEPREVRLITLSPGPWGEPLACRVEVDVFSPDLYYKYDVLSYAWGDEEDPQTITVEGGTGFRITIRKNLWIALRRIRHRKQTRRLWVDAICINQSDKDGEKDEQLKGIGDIYKHCAKCIIWLGDFPMCTPVHGPSKAVKLLEMFASCGPRDELSTDGEHALVDKDETDKQTWPDGKHVFELECFHHHPEEKRTDVSKDYKGHFEALTTLLNLEWWKRTWVIQELALPNQVELLVDSQSLPYETLAGAVMRLTRHSLLKCCKNHRLGLRGLGFEAVVTIEEQLHSMVLARQHRLGKKPITFTQLRRRFCGSEASWKRDSFYGFLGIVTNTAFLTPSYKLPLRTAITEATFGCVKSEPDGVELLLGERLFRDQNGRLDVPSWVSDACFCTFPPRWALMERRRLSIYLSFARENSKSDEERETFVGNLEKTEDGILITESYQVATIENLADVLVATEQWSHVPGILASWMKFAGIEFQSWSQNSPAKDSRMDIFWRTMINNSTEEDGDSLEYGRPTDRGPDSDYSRLRWLWALLETASQKMTLFENGKAWWAVLKTAFQGMTLLGNPKALSAGSEGSLFETLDAMITMIMRLADNPVPSEQSFSVGMEAPELHDLVVGMDAKMIYHLLACLWERRLFMTEGGDIGLAPRDAEKGDEIHIIPGCPAPFILRRVGDPKSSDYMVVGNGFFHGFMGGGIPNVPGVDQVPRKIALH
ncbi:heterokaryon incompatibility protein-domain-containing protein [Chaetomium sp. MPI-CAGE-AT-0009]|nr:heterokaryon incompatibility protein-domain-containing protein [Chaetomium sp. MPI-CAGE-AT-0009]